MKRFITTGVLLALILCAVGGCRHPASQVAPGPPVASSPNPQRDEVLRAFRERARSEQLREFDLLVTKRDAESRDQAMTLVLLRLKHWELTKIGIFPFLDDNRWVVATTPGVGPGENEAGNALTQAIQRTGLNAEMVWVDHGTCLWAVAREEFCRAQRLLSGSAGLDRLGVRIIQPTVSLW